MMTPEAHAFIAAFQKRLKRARKERGYSQKEMAALLHVGIDAYKKYESREGSAFPIHLVPPLILITEKPLYHWMGITPQDAIRKRPRYLTVVNADEHN